MEHDTEGENGKRLSKSLKVKVNFNEIENCKNNNKPGKF